MKQSIGRMHVLHPAALCAILVVGSALICMTIIQIIRQLRPTATLQQIESAEDFSHRRNFKHRQDELQPRWWADTIATAANYCGAGIAIWEREFRPAMRSRVVVRDPTSAERKQIEERIEKERSKRKNAIEISANKLAEAYERDETKANALYLQKYLRVTGRVRSVENAIAGRVYIAFWLDSADKDLIVQCFINQTEKVRGRVSALSTGEKVSLTGQCLGKFGFVQLDDCELD